METIETNLAEFHWTKKANRYLIGEEAIRIFLRANNTLYENYENGAVLDNAAF